MFGPGDLPRDLPCGVGGDAGGGSAVSSRRPTGAMLPVLAAVASLGALAVVFVVLLNLGGGREPESGAQEKGDNPLVGLGEDAGAGNGNGRAPEAPEAPADGESAPREEVAEPLADPVADPQSGQPAGQGTRDPGTADPPPVAAGDDSLGAHDPLGVADEREAEGVYNGARLSAANFVTYCYGYSGEDAGQYTEGVEQVIFYPEFYRSDGGEAVKRVIGAIEREGSVTAAAKLDEFRALPGIPEDEGSLRVEIRFSVGDAFAPPAEWPDGEPALEGGSRAYVQELEMARAGGRSEIWKVYQAGPVRQA